MKTLADYVPHQPPMRLVERALEVGSDRAVTEAKVTADNPFFRAESAGVPAWIGLEYLAQTAAVWLGAACERDGRPIQPAFLISSRELVAHRPVLAEGQRLRIEVSPDWADRPLVAFKGRILGENNETLIEAVFAAYQPDDMAAYLADTAPDSSTQ